MFKRSSLKPADCEMLATVVSVLNGCDYCIKHHAEALHFYWKDPGRIERLVRNYRAADLSREQLTLAEYAEKLTANPSAMTEKDVDKLKDAGFSDRQILDANLIVSYFNFANRIADGLGVRASKEEVAG